MRSRQLTPRHFHTPPLVVVRDRTCFFVHITCFDYRGGLCVTHSLLASVVSYVHSHLVFDLMIRDSSIYMLWELTHTLPIYLTNTLKMHKMERFEERER